MSITARPTHPHFFSVCACEREILRAKRVSMHVSVYIACCVDMCEGSRGEEGIKRRRTQSELAIISSLHEA